LPREWTGYPSSSGLRKPAPYRANAEDLRHGRPRLRPETPLAEPHPPPNGTVRPALPERQESLGGFPARNSPGGYNRGGGQTCRRANAGRWKKRPRGRVCFWLPLSSRRETSRFREARKVLPGFEGHRCSSSEWPRSFAQSRIMPGCSVAVCIKANSFIPKRWQETERRTRRKAAFG